jgi:hypothetical protein
MRTRGRSAPTQRPGFGRLSLWRRRCWRWDASCRRPRAGVLAILLPRAWCPGGVTPRGREREGMRDEEKLRPGVVRGKTGGGGGRPRLEGAAGSSRLYCKIKRRLGGSGQQGPCVHNISKMISMCWMNMPFGRNHPARVKFVVSLSFAIASVKKGFSPLERVSSRADRAFGRRLGSMSGLSAFFAVILAVPCPGVETHRR